MHEYGSSYDHNIDTIRLPPAIRDHYDHIHHAGYGKVLVDNVVRLHGTPDKVVSDRDDRFIWQFWNSFQKLLGVQLLFSSANHPETDGQTENVNGTLGQLLRAYCMNNPNGWVSFLPLVEFAYNSSE